MPEGILCNRKPINTEEDLKRILADKGGKQYYEEMKNLEVDVPALQRTLEKTCKSRTRTWLEICAHCSLCADSCFFYKANNRDVEQTPSYKINTTLGEMIKRKGNVDTEFMIRAMDIAWGKCTCCNRCGNYCPHGIDVGVMMSYLRGVLYSQGFCPWEMKIGAGMHRVYRAQMDVTTEDWVDTCQWMEEEGQEQIPSLEIPIDKEDCDIMYVLNAREPKIYPDDVQAAAMLFHIAGESWTVPSEGWENTSLSMFAGDWEACAGNVKAMYDAIERLRPKMVVETECGHAHRASAIEGPYWAGKEDGKAPVPYLHYVEWLANAIRSGKIKIDPTRKIKEPCTLQDSCNYIRNHGLEKHTRYIMSQIAEDFREMEEHGAHNYCCGGGGGMNGIGRYREERDAGLFMKLQQIRATGATLVISPCHNCWDAIRDTMEVYKVHDIKWSFLKPLILDMCIIPDHLKPQDDEEE
ncbi:sulfate respiration complex iron-sulfur protein HmcF [Mailhella sp.]|uniref:sulfate respiration complex iron-sulfur protein HmcF n=1 Tax=Mailhella sp. TaxID=1981029 RepID=UPI004062E7EC